MQNQMPPPVASGTYPPVHHSSGFQVESRPYGGHSAQQQPAHSETDPLATSTSPYLGAHDFADARNDDDSYRGGELHPGQQQQAHGDPDEAYTAIALGSPQGHGGPGPLEYPPAAGAIDSDPAPRTSLSTYNSLTQLRAVEAGGAYLPTARRHGGDNGEYEMQVDSRPVNPTVTIDPSAIQQTGSTNSARAERMYGSSAEKRNGHHSSPSSGNNSPRSQSRDRSRGGGLGQWSGPAGGNSPYGRLGDENGGGASGFNSAASSNPNLQFADGDFIVSGRGNWFSRMVLAIYNSHYVVRWM